MIRFIRLGLAGLFLTGAALQGAGAPETPPPTVTAAPVRMVKETEPKRYVGSAIPVSEVDVMPRVTGTLLKTHFQDGDMVKQGTLLYELEDTTYRAKVEVLKAQLEQQQAALRYADVEFKRNSSLLKSRAVSATSHDKAFMEIETAKARIKEIKASLLDAENNLSYTRIFAPISGQIGKSVSSDGNLITPTGGKLTDIKMIAPIYVRFSLSERVFRRDFGGSEAIKSNARVQIQLADGTIYPETAKITFQDNKVSATTNTITFWATFQNKDSQLLPGCFVTVLLHAQSGRAVPAIPPSALIADENGYFVYVLEAGNKAVRRAVKTGPLSGKLQIVTSGLTGTECVIVDGTHKVKPGMTVRPMPSTQTK